MKEIRKKKKSDWSNIYSIKKIILICLVIIALVIFLHLISSDLITTDFFSEENITQLLQKTGIRSWIIYILFVAIMVISPLPSPAAAVIAGYVFNPLVAIFLTLVGEGLGASGNYLIGKELSEKVIEKRFPKMKKTIEKHGKNLHGNNIFLLAMIPAGTSNITAFAAAIANIKLQYFLTYRMSGITVLVLFTTYFGYTAKQQSWQMSVIIFIIAVIFTLIIKKRIRIMQTNKINSALLLK